MNKLLVILLIYFLSLNSFADNKLNCDESLKSNSWNTTINYLISSDQKNDVQNKKLNEALEKAYLNKDYVTSVKIVGHASLIGPEEANMYYSKKRALDLEKAFLSLGVDKAVFTTTWEGETNPIVNEISPEANWKNQRAEVTFTYAKNSFENCQKKVKVISKEIVKESPKKKPMKSKFKVQPSYFLELATFSAEFASKVNGITGVNEVVSNVTISGEAGAYFKIAPKISIGASIGIRPIKNETELASFVEEDYLELAFRGNALLLFDMNSFWSHELLLLFDQKSYMLDVPSKTGSGRAWNFDLENVFQIEYRSHFKIHENKYVKATVTPLFSYFIPTDILEGNTTSMGLQVATDFPQLWNLGIVARYFVTNYELFGSDVGYEILEVGMRKSF